MKVSVLIGLAAATLLLGCKSGEFEKVRGELKACEARRASLQQEANSYREESERQKQSCQAIQAALEASIPPPVEDARKEFLESVPPPVQLQVQFQLEKYFATVARNFKQLKDHNQEVLQELKQARRELAKTSGQVEKVATSASNLEEGLAAVQKGNDEARQLREQLQAQQQKNAAEIQKVIASIIEFDRNRLNCRECRERLRMMDKNREEILRFHSSLIEQMTALKDSTVETEM